MLKRSYILFIVLAFIGTACSSGEQSKEDATDKVKELMDKAADEKVDKLNEDEKKKEEKDTTDMKDDEEEMDDMDEDEDDKEEEEKEEKKEMEKVEEKTKSKAKEGGIKKN